MNVGMRKLLLTSFIIMICVALLFPQMALGKDESPSFFLNMSKSKLQEGDTIEVEVQSHHLKDMYAFEINLDYDTSKLKFIGAASSIKGFSVKPIVKGKQLTFAHTKTGAVAGVSGDAVLCTLTFTAVAAGTAAIELKDVKLVNSKLDFVINHTNKKENVVITPKLKDITGHWAEAYIQQALQLGFVNGYADNTFRPNRQITRAEFTAILVRALQLSEAGTEQLTFSDKDQIPAWAKTYISTALKAGIISGYPDNSFKADKDISRYEMTAMIVKALGLEISVEETPPFSDMNDMPDWAVPYVTAAFHNKLVQGKGNNRFEGKQYATRAEALKIIITAIQQ